MRESVRMRSQGILAVVMVAVLVAAPTAAQGPTVGAPIADAPNVVGGPGSANYELAARWAPYKLQDLVYSTSVQPRWIEGSDRFWYEWETSEGTFYWLVDMARNQQRQIFETFPEGGYIQGNDIEPVIEITAKSSSISRP